jgi:hypothetical protein
VALPATDNTESGSQNIEEGILLVQYGIKHPEGSGIDFLCLLNYSPALIAAKPAGYGNKTHPGWP